MDLWSPSHKWAAHPDTPAGVAPQVFPDHDEEHEHEEAAPTVWATIIMWLTVLMPYAALVALFWWTAFVVHGWTSLIAFAVAYLAIGFGVTIGYHRLLAHRAFNSYRWIEGTFYVLGCMAMQGPPIRWAATHRRHHQTSDHDGDPHSPHLAGNGVRGVILGLWHAHTGWLLTPDKPHIDRSVKDLLRDPMIRRIDRLYWLWLLISIAVPFGVGWAFHHSVLTGLSCVFWAVIVRIALMHHATWSVNSICHFFGYRTYRSDDHSRNNPIIAVISLGEGWHNNHHAFPTSARHGMRWYEIDLSWIIIRSFELVGLMWDVRRPSITAKTAKAI